MARKQIQQKINPIIIPIIFGAATAGGGIWIQLNYADQWLTVLNIATSVALTTALVVLYYRQSSILRSQKDLKETEIDLEVRKQHTEVLRERVIAWHGNTEPTQMPDDPLFERRNNGQTDSGLPQVTDVGFKPADAGPSFARSIEESEFHTIPPGLRDDPFLVDFLQNHGVEVNQARKQVERHQAEFSSIRSKFTKQLEAEFRPANTEYEIEWVADFSLGIFRSLLQLEQNQTLVNSWEEDDGCSDSQIDIICEGVGIGGSPMTGETLIMSLNINGSSEPIAEVDSYEFEEAKELEEALISETKRELRRNLDSTISNRTDQTVARAIRELHQGKEAIRQLERKLEEYAGRPIYRKNCKYINNASISDV